MTPLHWWELSSDQQFWLTFVVNAAVAFATFLAAMVALFGSQFWTWAFPPVLKMKRVEDYGEKTIATYAVSENVGADDEVRFFHLRVWNERRWATAHQVQVFLTALEQLGPNGQWHVIWTGNVPMRWRDQEVNPFRMNIGTPIDCDFCMVSKSRRFIQLMPLIAPNNLKVHWEGECRFLARLQARSTEKDSAEYNVEVSWDGKWEDGDLEMRNHLTVDLRQPGDVG
jgi:hypothetical protein